MLLCIPSGGLVLVAGAAAAGQRIDLIEENRGRRVVPVVVVVVVRVVITVCVSQG